MLSIAIQYIVTPFDATRMTGNLAATVGSCQRGVGRKDDFRIFEVLFHYPWYYSGLPRDILPPVQLIIVEVNPKINHLRSSQAGFIAAGVLPLHNRIQRAITNILLSCDVFLSGM